MGYLLLYLEDGGSTVLWNTDALSQGYDVAPQMSEILFITAAVISYLGWGGLKISSVERNCYVFSMFYKLFNDVVTVCTIARPMVGWLMNEKLERILKEAVLNSFRHYPACGDWGKPWNHSVSIAILKLYRWVFTILSKENESIGVEIAQVV